MGNEGMAKTRRSARKASFDKLAEIDGRLLEGPCWDSCAEQVLMVDIIGGKIIAVDWSSRQVTSIRTGESVSAVMPRHDGDYVAACRRGIARVNGRDGDLELLLPIELDRWWTRTNDAKCDPAGRLWVGTMADDERAGAGSLYRVDARMTCAMTVSSVTISNGLGWSPDTRSMYYIDSPTRNVDVFDFDVASGEIENRRVLIDACDYKGLPDGMSVDVEGCLWVAFYGGSAVRRFAPDGTLLAVVELPRINVTSCAFVGPQLDHLVITTAGVANGINEEETGAVYVLKPNVVGVPTSAFAG